MKTVTSISGGQTSAYLAAKFPTDYNVFALVRIEDQKSKFPDAKIRKLVEDKIQKPFIATAEDDVIIYTMLDLEQFLGRPIDWVSGIPFDEVVRTKGGYLPNKLHRYCTTHLKIEPIFYWWAEKIGTPAIFNIGYRANEGRRKEKMQERLNESGLSTFEATFEKNARGQNKWQKVEWQKPQWPLIDDKPTFKDEIIEFWANKPVRFAALNNCVGCFHRNPLLLKKQFELHPAKMGWFAAQERMKMNKNRKATWRTDVTYDQIKRWQKQFELNLEDFNDCDSGYCGV
jgi:hypothetical protein